MNTYVHLFLTIIFAPLSAAYQAFVGVILWSWFVLPIFGIEAPSLWILAGLAVFVRLMFGPPVAKVSTSDKENLERFAHSISASIVLPTISLFFGWVYHLFA